MQWKVSTWRRFRPAWGDRPLLRGDRAPFVCQVDDCESPSYYVVGRPEHMAVVCLPHADQLYVEEGYVFVAEVGGHRRPDISRPWIDPVMEPAAGGQ